MSARAVYSRFDGEPAMIAYPRLAIRPDAYNRLMAECRASGVTLDAMLSALIGAATRGQSPLAVIRAAGLEPVRENPPAF